MSRAAKQGIILLTILLVAALGFSGITLMEKQNLIKQKADLEQQLEEARQKERNFTFEKTRLEEELAKERVRREELEKRVSTVDEDMARLQTKLEEVTRQRDEWRQKVAQLEKEAAQLKGQIKQQPEKQETEKPLYSASSLETQLEGLKDDAYWAAVLKQKAALELEVERLKNELSRSAIETAELKKAKSDLQMQIENLQRQLEDVNKQLQDNKDLADSLSIELARAHNDKKYLETKIKDLEDSNATLQQQLKKLTSTKIALEKSLVRLEEEKKELAKKLTQTESVIQKRIDEIWRMKAHLEEQIKTVAATDEIRAVELPPIIVSADEEGVVEEIKSPQPVAGQPGFSANVLTVNQENNFIVFDRGSASGVKVGDVLNVYRGGDFIAQVEVIQVRRDLAAADIRNQTQPIKVGDIVR